MDCTNGPSYIRIIEILLKFGSALKHEILPTSTIQLDCSIDGDDAEALFAELESEFQTDFSKFQFQKYFHDELFLSFGVMLLPVTPLCWAVMRMTKTGKKIDLTVEDLYQAVKTGSWIDPERTPKYPWEQSRVNQ